MTDPTVMQLMKSADEFQDLEKKYREARNDRDFWINKAVNEGMSRYQAAKLAGVCNTSALNIVDHYHPDAIFVDNPDDVPAYSEMEFSPTIQVTIPDHGVFFGKTMHDILRLCFIVTGNGRIGEYVTPRGTKNRETVFINEVKRILGIDDDISVEVKYL